MELYVPRLPSIRIHLLLLLTCCAFLFPCSLCLDKQYQYCNNTGRTCGNLTFNYPFGVGKYGCGDPAFQIDCGLYSTPVIAINKQNYTILEFYQNNNSFVIVRGEDCHFLDPLNIGSEFAGTAFNITSRYNWTLDVYKCITLFSDQIYDTEGGELRKCNDSVYYDLYGNGIPVYPLCDLENVTVEVYEGMTEWVYRDIKRNKSCKSCEERGGICGYDVSVPPEAAPFLCYCMDGQCPVQEKKDANGVAIGKKDTNGVAIAVSVGAAVLIAAGLLVGIIGYRRRGKSDFFRESLAAQSVRDDEDKDVEAAVQDKIGSLPIFSYEVLKQATNCFDEKNQLGDGGFGSVYLGKLPDGRAVAVKRLYQDNSRRVEQFINEVQILSSFNHPNLVILYGCTSTESLDLLLVYEYIPNGTLADHLHGEPKKNRGLNWDTRLKICIETAQALAFLHSLEPPIFHRDVKSTNILLDEHFQVKVADFGLSRFGLSRFWALKIGKKDANGVAIGVSVGAAVLIAAGLLVGIILYAKRRKPAPRCSILKVEEFLKEYADQMPTRYSQSQLKKISNNFAEKLGEGGFGVVYKGKLRNGTLVAVKLLGRHRRSESTEFMNEVATIGRLHHVNLVRLLGYCFDSFTSALVYEYMINGSLEKLIFAGKEKGQVLMWEQLYSIALGVARGIAYLHQDCEKRIVHFDIKPHNAKVADFGLAKLCGKGEDHISMTAGRGTPGYVAPEVCDRDVGPVTDKSDVYSFGMLLLEIVGGRKNFDSKVCRASQSYFPEWAFKLLESGELVMRLRREGELKAEDEEKARRLTKVGLWCIQYNYRDRPGMSRVVQMLEENGEDVPNPPLPSNFYSAEPEKPLLSYVEESCSMGIN